MAMTTRCPQCGTAFKVVPDQLRVRNGLVRCGACSTVFDGRASLVAHIPQTDYSAAGVAPVPRPPEPSTVPPQSVPQQSVAQPPMPSPHPVMPSAGAVPPPPAIPPVSSSPAYRAQTREPFGADETDPLPGVTLRPEPRLGAIPAPPAVLRGRRDMRRHDPYVGQPEDDDDPVYDAQLDVADEPGFYPDRREQVGASDETPWAGQSVADASLDIDDDHEPAPAVRGEARTRFYGATDVGRTPPEFLDPEHQARRSMLRSLWGYGCALGLLLLALQLVYVYRTAIALAAPQMRPLLTSVCEPLGCQVGYARRLERIFVTASSLQPPRGQADAAASDEHRRMVLRATLRNRYDKPQHWPALRLELKDLSDSVVASKVLLPDDYLPPGQAATPFQPAAELDIEVPIDIKGAHVNGYQLHKFFP